MRWCVMRFALPFLLAVSMFGGSLATPLPAGAVPPSIQEVRTGGVTVVWLNCHYSCALFMRPLSGGAQQQVATNVSTPDVSGDLLVWQEQGPTGPRLAGRHVAGGTPLSLPGGPGYQMAPSLSGSRLVWVRYDQSNASAPWQILTTDLAAPGSPTVVATLGSNVQTVDRPEVSGDWVVWAEQLHATGSDPRPWELWAEKLGGSAFKVAAGTDSGYLSGYDVGGNFATYGAAGQVHLIDLRDLSSDRAIGAGGSPTTDGRYVFWNVYFSGQGPRSDLLGYDIVSDSAFGVAVNTGGMNYGARTRGGEVAWVFQETQATGALTVEVSSIESVLPSAPQPDPGETDPNWTYFGATGHYLSYGFRTFWEQSGGLPVFGYPLTEEFLQHGRTTQYTERQRFEYHPELRLTLYETELGRLGAEDAQARGLLTTGAFQPLAPGTQPTPGCLLFSETSHQVCGAFLAYWQTHGLELRDPGLSFRESLALFGYPLSEKYIDPATGLETQYFERAVFEWHPGNPEPFKVELRLLGSEQLQAAGWR